MTKKAKEAQEFAEFQAKMGHKIVPGEWIELPDKPFAWWIGQFILAKIAIESARGTDPKRVAKRFRVSEKQEPEDHLSSCRECKSVDGLFEYEVEF